MIKNVHPPQKPPDYITAVFHGGLGDALLEVTNGHFARHYGRPELRFFVVDSTDAGTFGEYIAGRPKVAGFTVQPLYNLISPFPLIGHQPDEPPDQSMPPVMVRPEPQTSLRPAGRYAVIHPFASSDHKSLFIAVNVGRICRVVKALGMTPVVVGAEKKNIRVGDCLDLRGKTDIRQLADLVEGADIVIGSHSCVLTFGWALRKNCFAIIPDLYFLYKYGKTPRAEENYVKPIYREDCGFLYFSRAKLFDRFFIHFLRKCGHPVSLPAPRNKFVGINKLKPRGLNVIRVR